jgi:MSHA biogenesis protein MshN
MSLINKMLQDLDRRQALGVAANPAGVRPSAPRSGGGREWFWRTLAVLMVASVAWVAWVAYQLMPRPGVFTEDALRAGAQAQKNRAQAKAPAVAPVVAAPAAAPVAAPVAPPAAPAVVATPETFKLALEILTPIAEPQMKEAAKPAARPAPKAADLQGSVNKRDRARSNTDSAESHFRRAVVLMNQGRISEAEDQLVAALVAQPAHVQARQAYVSLLLEQRRVDAARRVLQEALALNPAQPTFALALARIHAQQREYGAALEVMDRTGAIAGNADFQALRGVILQRMGRDGEAVEALQNAIRGGPQPGATWVSLGISLEALARRPEAAQAYRRALDTGPLAAEAREYAAARARALE